MGLGALLLLGVNRQRAVPLRAPLTTMPSEIQGYRGHDRAISPEEQQVAGMSQYLLRDFGSSPEKVAFSLYVGYYEWQTQGRTIHSPRNCLPGAGWEPIGISYQLIPVEDGRVTVQRYLLGKGNQRALVYYWYQGRGRISSNEYKVKLELLRDAALTGRSEEALVRIVLPLDTPASEPAADSLAAQVALAVIPAMNRALPSFR
jgi:EpsI family protein